MTGLAMTRSLKRPQPFKNFDVDAGVSAFCSIPDADWPTGTSSIDEIVDFDRRLRERVLAAALSGCEVRQEYGERGFDVHGKSVQNKIVVVVHGFGPRLWRSIQTVLRQVRK